MVVKLLSDAEWDPKFEFVLELTFYLIDEGNPERDATPTHNRGKPLISSSTHSNGASHNHYKSESQLMQLVPRSSSPSNLACFLGYCAELEGLESLLTFL